MVEDIHSPQRDFNGGNLIELGKEKRYDG